MLGEAREGAMSDESYGQFCPVAMASELLCTRWTMVLLRELVCGSTRFNDLRRGVPRMSPALLSKRLRQLREAGIVERDGPHYRLTEAGADLRAVVEAFGCWGQAWFESEPSLRNLDAGLLMWDMRRHLVTEPMPKRRCVVQFTYPDRPESERRWWLIVAPGEPVDLCSVDPGHDVDLYVHCDLRVMTEVWMGLTTVARARDADRLLLTGDRAIEGSMQRWLGLSPFARVEKRVA